MTFSADLAKFAKKTNQNIDSAVREVVLSLAVQVDERSPVGNPDIWTPPGAPAGYVGGHFRANNQYRFGSLPINEVEGVDASGTTATAAVKAGVYSSPVAGVHYIANNVPYAMALENGHSTQAPKGIYKLSMISVVGGLRRIIQGAIK